MSQLEFRDRIYTWDGRCWVDKNGVSRTSYLIGKGIIAAGYNGGAKDKNSAGGMKGKNHFEKFGVIKFRCANEEDVIDVDGDNEGGHQEPVVNNKEGDKIGNHIYNEGDKSSAAEQSSLSSAYEQLCSVSERLAVNREVYIV